MPDISYRVIRQRDHLFSVEMIRKSGKRRIIPDFRDKADAEAWIVQIERARHQVDPRHTVPTRRTG